MLPAVAEFPPCWTLKWKKSIASIYQPANGKKEKGEIETDRGNAPLLWSARFCGGRVRLAPDIANWKKASCHQMQAHAFQLKIKLMAVIIRLELWIWCDLLSSVERKILFIAINQVKSWRKVTCILGRIDCDGIIADMLGIWNNDKRRVQKITHLEKEEKCQQTGIR